MMKPRKLTDKGLERMAPPATGRVEVWDKEAGGFGVRVTDKGTKTFQVMYRFGGKLRRKTLGQFPVMGLGDARDKARSIQRLARGGIDPEIAEQEEAAARARAQADTFLAVREQFIAVYAKPKNKSWREAERYFERDLTEWDARPITTIARRDVIAAIDAKARTAGPYAANRLLAHVRKLFAWAAGRDLIATSPVVNIPTPGAEQERERVLSATEIEKLWRAWDGMAWPFGPMLKLLLATGQRRGEVASMRWTDIRPRATAEVGPDGTVTPIEWIWTIPREQTKGARTHEVPLAPLAHEIIGNLPRRSTGTFVFPARGSIDRPASGFSKAKATADTLSGIADWRIHDLRRTCGTGMAGIGIAVSTISKVLNHAEGGVTKIYNRYSYGAEKRVALEAWANKLKSIVEPKPEKSDSDSIPDNVIALRA